MILQNPRSISIRIEFLFIIALTFIAFLLQDSALGTGLPPGDKPPPTAFDRIESAGSAEDYTDADHVIVYDLSVNRVKESGVTQVDEYVLHKIITVDGCKNFSVLTWDYDPQSSYVKINEVNLIRDGEKIPVDVSKVLDLPAPQSGIYWGNRIKTLQLPRLQVDDGIEIKTFHKGFTYALLAENQPPGDENYIPPMPGEYFDIVRFEGTAPIIEKKYILAIPESKRLHSQVYNGTLYSRTSYTADSTIYCWWALDIPAWKPERYHPGTDDIVTKVVLSTAESWEAKSRWFFEINENQFNFTPAISAKVEEIFKQAEISGAGEDEKAKALVHWVAQNIRYSGQTMGIGEGFTLHTGEMIFRQRSGVCKDIAGMLVTMMRAAGMDSYAAMTMAGSRIEDLPADQFNHCVVALKKADGNFEMYDPTWVPFYKDIWSKLESEQHYVIGTPEGKQLDRIRYSPPEESPLQIESTAIIDKDGNLRGTIDLKGDGAVDSRLRRIASGRRRSELKAYIADMLHPISDRIEGISFEQGDLYDFSKGMWFRINYSVPSYGLPVDGGLEFKSPMMLLTMRNRLLLRPGDYKWEEDRNDDVFLYYTQLVTGAETITLPRGFSLSNPPDDNTIDGTYAFFKGDAEMKGRKLHITQRIELRRRQITPEGYAGFRDAMNGATDFSETVYRVEKGS